MDGGEGKIVDIRLAEKTGLFSNRCLRGDSQALRGRGNEAAIESFRNCLTKIFFGAKK